MWVGVAKWMWLYESPLLLHCSEKETACSFVGVYIYTDTRFTTVYTYLGLL